jgi:hypothetical protein
VKIKARIKIKDGDPKLVNTFGNRGIQARNRRGNILVKLPASKEINGAYEIPTEIASNKNVEFLISCTEHVKKRGNTESVTIVCGLSGKELHPYYIPLRGNIQAYFDIPKRVVTITCDCNSKEITIEEHCIVRKGNIVKINTEKLWSGETKVIEWECYRCGKTFMEFPNEHTGRNGGECYGKPSCARINIPSKLERFQPASIKAWEKSNHRQNQYAHYIANPRNRLT